MFTLNFYWREAIKSLFNLYFCNRIIQEPKAFERMRPHWYLRKFISPSGSIHEPINLLIFHHFYDLKTSWMTISNWFKIIDIVWKDNVIFFLIKLMKWLDGRILFVVFWCYLGWLKFRPEYIIKEIDSYKDDIGC